MGFDIISPGGSAAAAGGLDVTTTARFYNDYVAVAVSGWTSYVSGTGAAVAATTTNQEKNRPGISRLRSGSTNAGIANSYLATSFDFGNAFTYRAGVLFEDLSTGAEEYEFIAGIEADVTTGFGAHGIYFHYDRAVKGANMFAVVDDDSGTTSTDTGITLAADTWYDLAIVMNAAYDSCEFYMDGVLVATTTTNFPDTGVDSGYPQLKMEKSVGTTERIIYLDYMLYEQTVARP